MATIWVICICTWLPLNQILGKLDPSIHLDAAIRAIITNHFPVAGKFTVPTLPSFDPTMAAQIFLANISEKTGRIGFAFQLSRTKCSMKKGHAQRKLVPHTRNATLQINNPAENAHLFAYKTKNGYRVLTKFFMIQKFNTVAKTLGLERQIDTFYEDFHSGPSKPSVDGKEIRLSPSHSH